MSRFENVLLLVASVAFWGFDVYLVTIDVNSLKYQGFPKTHAILCAVLTLFLFLPYFFYYRLKRHQIKNNRVNNIYFPLTILLIILLVINARITISPRYLASIDYFNVLRNTELDSSVSMTLFFWIIGAYMFLQLLFSIDSLCMIRKQRMENIDMINNIGRG